jgi:hypothetical protein
MPINTAPIFWASANFFQHRRDQQNAIRAGRARFVNLVRLEDKVLAQERNVDSCAHRAKIVERAFEMDVGQNGDRGSVT